MTASRTKRWKPPLVMRTEHEEQCLVFAWAQVMGGRYPELGVMFAVPNFAKITPRWGAYMKAEGKKSGVPDIVLPVARGGYHSLFVEMKRADGGVTYAAQEAWHLALTDQGNYVAICEGAEAAQ